MFRCVAAGGAAAGVGFLYLRESAILQPTSGGFAKVKDAVISEKRVLHGDYDVVVLGGGVIGLATAREVQKRYPDKTIAVLEKEPSVAVHQSGHNSGVIHAGMYYEPGSVMARCCVEGADLMYAYAKEKDIPHERVGKLIVATTAAEDETVQKLYARGVQNGVKDLQVLTGAQVRGIEPNVVATSALESPNTGIIDFGAVAKSLQSDLEQDGASVKFNYEVQDFKAVERGVEVVGREPGQAGPTKVVSAKNVITCAGLWMDKVGELGGGAVDPRVLTFRGAYWQMRPEYRNIVKRNIYPVPSGGGIAVGVHFTPTTNLDRGRAMIVGPGACLCFAKEGYKMTDVSPSHLWNVVQNVGFWNFAFGNFNMAVTEVYRDMSRRAFMDQARKLVPSVTDDMVEESFCGVMAQVFTSEGNAASDYILERKMLNGTTLHLRNAPSPGATSSLAIAKHLVDVAESDFQWRVSEC